MEENKELSIQLEQFAEIAETLNTNKNIITTTITITLNSINFLKIISEIEQFVKVKIDRNQTKISLDINNVEFIFVKD
jgi:acyl carrier protein